MTAPNEAPLAPRGPRVHDIGVAGTVVIAVESDDVRIRGVDGTEARVVAPADGAGIETIAEPGRLTVRTAGMPRGGFVGIRIGSRGFGIQVSGTIELEVPRDARVEVGSAAGDVALRDIRGGATVRTAGGDVSIKRAAGRVAVNVASGDVAISGSEAISLDVHAVSGDVRARAPRFDRIAIQTISGDAEIGGTFGPAGGHAISTVSGDVELAVQGGLTVDVKTVSGDIDCDHPDRREGDGRRRPLVIGDGAARLVIRTMSGDVEVRAGRRGGPEAATDDAANASLGLAATPAPSPALPAATPAPPQPATPTAVPPASAGPAAVPAPTVEVTQRAPTQPPATGVAAPAPTPAASEGAAPTSDAATFAILEALACGEIDVGEAERRLAGTATAPAAAPTEAGTPVAVAEDVSDA